MLARNLRKTLRELDELDCVEVDIMLTLERCRRQKLSELTRQAAESKDLGAIGGLLNVLVQERLV